MRGEGEGEGEGGNVCFHSKHPQANTIQKLCSTTLIAPVVCSCEPTVPGDFAKVTKNDTWSKPFFPFRLHIHVKLGRIVICSYTLNVKTPVQLTTLNVKSATCDLFYLSMGIYHGYLPWEMFLRKYCSYSLKAVSRGRRVY